MLSLFAGDSWSFLAFRTVGRLSRDSAHRKNRLNKRVFCRKQYFKCEKVLDMVCVTIFQTSNR